MSLQGYIPEKMLYVFGPSEEITMRWDDLEPSSVVGEKVTPAFPLDATNTKRLATAEAWVENSRWKYRRMDGKWDRYQDPTPVQQVEVVNDKLEGFRVCGLEKRAEGGRAYKVADPNGYYFDLREDVLLDVILEGGIKKGGCLNGKYVWGVVNSQTKLVRVGSALHRALIEAGERRVMKKITMKNMKVGGVYEMKNGQRYMCLGPVNTIKCDESPIITSGVWRSSLNLRYKCQSVRGQHLFLKIADYSYGPKAHPENVRTPQQWFEESAREHYFYFDFKKTITVVNEVGVAYLPPDYLAQVRRGAVAQTNKQYEGRHYDRCVNTLIGKMALSNVVAGDQEPGVSAEYQEIVEKLEKNHNVKFELESC